MTMDERQSRVFRVLEARSKKLASIYRTALTMLESARSADSEMTRISLICHCLRELTTGAPEALSEIDIQRPKVKTQSYVDRLPRLLKGVDLTPGSDSVPIPKKAAENLAQLLAVMTQTQGRNRRLASALVTKSLDGDSPAISQWLTAHAFFEKWNHLDRLPDGLRELPEDDEISAHLRVVEDVIEAQYGFFFDGLQAIEDLLTRANEKIEAEE